MKNIVSPFLNPIFDEDFPDPSVLLTSDGWFYAYATQTIRQDGTWMNIQVIRSRDFVHWEILPDALPKKPDWASQTQSFWAPNVIEYAGAFYMYFAAQCDNLQGMALGVAVSDSASGPFFDVGQPLVVGTRYTHIDPFTFDDPDTGKSYLFWGSDRSPIFAHELERDRIHLKADIHPTVIMEPDLFYPYEELIEAPWVIKRNDWYYLFYSGDNCCGEHAHYALLVGRSRNILGPFQRMAETSRNKSSAILEGNDRWHAPGHNAIFTDTAGTDWVFYHAIDPLIPSILVAGEVCGSRRVLLMDRIAYLSDDWPHISSGSPSTSIQEGPVIH